MVHSGTNLVWLDSATGGQFPPKHRRMKFPWSIHTKSQRLATTDRRDWKSDDDFKPRTYVGIVQKVNERIKIRLFKKIV